MPQHAQQRPFPTRRDSSRVRLRRRDRRHARRSRHLASTRRVEGHADHQSPLREGPGSTAPDPAARRCQSGSHADHRSSRRGALCLAASPGRFIQQASDGPTWHLAVLATDAAHGGRGLARLLLDHVLQRCDADGLAAWLETTNPVNPPIYEGYGFETVTRIEGGRILPTWWIMRRDPHPTSL